MPPSDPIRSDTARYETGAWPRHNAASLSALHGLTDTKSCPTSHSADPDPSHRVGPRLDFAFHPCPDGLAIAIIGDLDIVSCDAFVDVVIGRLREFDRVLILDLGAVPFCDSSGVSALINIRKHCHSTGRHLTVTRPRPEVRRILVDFAGLGDYLDIQEPPPN